MRLGVFELECRHTEYRNRLYARGSGLLIQGGGSQLPRAVWCACKVLPSPISSARIPLSLREARLVARRDHTSESSGWHLVVSHGAVFYARRLVALIGVEAKRRCHLLLFFLCVATCVAASHRADLGPARRALARASHGPH
jgi:hypothetical protein